MAVLTGICKPVRLDSDVFLKIKHFPDPVPADNDHYLSFDTIYGKDTLEEHRPSLKKKSSLYHSMGNFNMFTMQI